MHVAGPVDARCSSHAAASHPGERSRWLPGAVARSTGTGQPLPTLGREVGHAPVWRLVRHARRRLVGDTGAETAIGVRPSCRPSFGEGLLGVLAHQPGRAANQVPLLSAHDLAALREQPIEFDPVRPRRALADEQCAVAGAEDAGALHLGMMRLHSAQASPVSDRGLAGCATCMRPATPRGLRSRALRLGAGRAHPSDSSTGAPFGARWGMAT